MKKEFRNLTAFTLAEVLLVLAIIGVIAALTIPSLNAETKKHEYVSALRKADSTLSQAIVKVKADNGPMGFGAAWRDGGEFWKAFTRTLNVIKICESGVTGCFTDGVIKKLDGSDGQTYNGWGYGVRTADGMSYQYTEGVDSAADLGLTTENAEAEELRAEARPAGRQAERCLWGAHRGAVLQILQTTAAVLSPDVPAKHVIQ